ncbi:hypothetical protein PV326_007816 [Microctonus aethiopoides]|nr:hypothetical protein PV326_007816 [Microctonus aethiopoides]
MNRVPVWMSIRDNLLDEKDSFLDDSFAVKNDEEKVETILQYLSEYETPLNVDGELKDAKKPDSCDLARAYANRSMALFNEGLYEESQMDIERALKIGCSKNLSTKLCARRAKCRLAMNKNSSPEFEELDTNELDEANEENKTTMNSSVNEPFEKVDYQNFMPEIPEDNCKIIGASAAVEINYSKKFGRQVMATRDIKAGETLLVHKSYASIVEPHLMHKYCWHCSKRVWAGVPCHQCVSVIYCNEICRDEAWQQHHDIECPTISAMLMANMEVVEMMTLRITIKAYKEAGTIERLKELLNEINAIQDPVDKCLSGNVFDCTKYASVYSLWRNITDEITHALKAAIILYFLAATTTIFGQKFNSFEELLNNNSTIFMGGLILRHVEISHMNCVTMCIDDDYGNPIDRSGILNPFISLFNHSCDPMVTHYVNGDINAIISLQNIKKGEQIFYDYGSLFWDKSTNKRRNKLLKEFGFLCECQACLNHWGPHSRLSFPSHAINSWPLDIENALNYFRAKYPNIISMGLADLEDKPWIISTTFDMINIYEQSISEYPTREMFEFKALLHVLYCSVRC